MAAGRFGSTHPRPRLSLSSTGWARTVAAVYQAVAARKVRGLGRRYRCLFWGDGGQPLGRRIHSLAGQGYELNGRCFSQEGASFFPLARCCIRCTPGTGSRQQYRLSRGRFPPVKMKTRRVARFDLRSAQRGPREYVPSCASTCAALPLEQMVNLLEEYESAKSERGSLESFDLRGTEGSNPPSSSREMRI